MNEEKQKQEPCLFYKICKIRLNPFAPADKPNEVAHLGFRFAYTVLAWIVLAKGISANTFFVSMFLFVLPVFMDCLKFVPTTNLRRKINKAEIFVTGFWCVIAILGLFGIFVVEQVEENFIITTAPDFSGFKIEYFSVVIVWRFLISVVAVTMVDWLTTRTNLEEMKLGEEVKK